MDSKDCNKQNNKKDEAYNSMYDFRQRWEKLGLSSFSELIGCELHGDWECKELKAMTTPPVKKDKPQENSR